MMKLLEFIFNREQGTGNKQTAPSLCDAPLPQAGRKQSRERAKKESVILSEPVGRNAPQLRTPPITEMSLGRPVVILNEVKDLGDGVAKERFFAHEAQNDKTPTPHTLSPERAKKGRGTLFVILSETKDLGDGTAKERFFAKEAQNDRIRDQGSGIWDQELWAPIRFAARAGDSAQSTSYGTDTGRSLRKERFFAKEALNDEIKNGCASRVQPRNPAYKSNMSQNDGNAGGHGNTLRALCQPLRLTSSTTSWSPFSKEKAKVSGARTTIVLLCLMLLAFIVNPVGAQEPTTRLFFNPTPLQIDTTIDPTGVVSLEVADGVDIFAFDLFVQYDPSLLRVSQVTLGDFLGEGLFCMDQVNEPGLVHYACTRFAVETGVSGSGVLLELTLEALGQGGDTLLLLEGSQLVNWPDASFVELTREDGAVSVRPYRTFLPLILSASGQGMEAMP